MSIEIPSRLDLQQVLAFSNMISKLEFQERFCFNFSKLSWVSPFGMLYIAQSIKGLKNRYPLSEIEYEGINNSDATSYAEFMGFFEACGFLTGSDSGTYFGNTYIPITYAKVSQIQSRDAIEKISLGLAQQLTQQDTGVLVDTLQYSFREIIRNVVEHSRSDKLAYCAQFWPKANSVELAILDTGRGLLSSLSQNPHLTLDSAQTAIKYALMPGISGTTYEGVKIRPDDVWQNSGYGLYMNYCLCNEGGSFFICSGDKGLYRKKNSDNQYYVTNFEGTAIRLQLNTKNIRNITEMIKQFISEGERLARQIGMGAIPNASTMSKMLKNNFKVDYKIEINTTVRHQRFGVGFVTEKLITPQGEMLWVSFDGGRRKKVLSADVILVETEEFDYYDEIYVPVDIYDDIDEEFDISSFNSLPEDDF